MDIVLRAVIVYVVVYGFTRLLGRRELSDLQPFDLILLIVIGDLIQIRWAVLETNGEISFISKGEDSG